MILVTVIVVINLGDAGVVLLAIRLATFRMARPVYATLSFSVGDRPLRRAESRFQIEKNARV